MDFEAILKQATEIRISTKDYMGHLQQLLETEEDLPPFPGHAKQEEILRKENTSWIACSIPMPPGLQALRVEDLMLCNEILDLMRVGGNGTEKHKELVSRRELVNSIIMDWVDDELGKRPDIFRIVRNRDTARLIGRDWHMLIVVDKTRKNKR